MKKKIFICTLFLFTQSCSKGINSSDYAKSLLSGKTWFLDYSIQNNITKSFIGKSTYFIQFAKNDQTIDSDGLIGNFSVEELNSILSIKIHALTPSGTTANYTYQIDQIGLDQLIVSFRQDSIVIKKIFSTTH
jgi:hypothetical protein